MFVILYNRIFRNLLQKLKLKKDELSLIDKDYIAFNTKKEIEINKLFYKKYPLKLGIPAKAS